MRTLGHIIASAGIGLFTYHRYKSPGAGIASFLVGWLIDVDHVVDYVKAHGWRPNWEKISEAKHEHYSGKLYLLLHSYELLALFFLLFKKPEKRAYRVGITLSVLTHLLLDQKCNPCRKPLTYFLAHRAYKGFNAVDILHKL
ncbi:MAG: hypothetical protein K2X77_01535 [Candidatus Obscuribacterales bacterium]|jgi:membrane-bound metal-dependent hydrolase YbcI (DUF457 family)|nr:hypothetical protein [Candidatus Obscuribacterales bacterium]